MSRAFHVVVFRAANMHGRHQWGRFVTLIGVPLPIDVSGTWKTLHGCLKHGSISPTAILPQHLFKGMKNNRLFLSTGQFSETLGTLQLEKNSPELT